MVSVWINDEVWKKFKDSWGLYGVRTFDELVRMLEIELWENSCSVLGDAELHLIDDTPEALTRREIGLEKERKHAKRSYRARKHRRKQVYE